MRVSNTTAPLDEKIGLRNTIAMMKEVGFDCFDFNLDSKSDEIRTYFTADNYLELVKDLRSFADKTGITCNQAHAPFPTSYGDSRDADVFDSIVRSIEIASIMGAQIIVVHPMQHLNYQEHQRELFQMNVNFYTRLLPYAEKFGIKVATENMWQDNNASRIPSDSVCSRAWEFCELIDAVNSPWLVGCLDIGHAFLMAADIPQFIRSMGKHRLQALHVHDTDLVHDAHTMPFLLNIDFEQVAAALGEIDYQGDLTLEVITYYCGFPKALYKSAARLLCDTGKYLADHIDTNRNSIT